MTSSAVSRRAFATGLAVASTGLHGCAEVTDLYGIRLDIQLLLPEGVLNVVAVRRVVEIRHYDWVPTANKTAYPVRGQAIPVDIAGRTLFFTKCGYTVEQDGESDRTLLGWWLPISLHSGVKDWREAPDSLVIELEPLQIPAMVIFDDPAIVETIRVVMPSELPKEFPGVRLGRCTVRPSRDRPTMTDVEKRLPWLQDHGRTPELGDSVYADRYMFGL